MIDSHAHVAFEQFDRDREEVLKRANEAGVRSWIEVGSDVNNSHRAADLARGIDGVYAAVGVHPNSVKKMNEGEWREISDLLRREEVVAVGEVGLDYYRGGSLEEQIPFLIRFVELANSLDLPIIFHMRSGEERDAHEDLLSFLTGLKKRERPQGVVHMFSGNLEQANRYVNLGLFLGISGIVTFKNAGYLVEVVENVSLDKILVETDCPYVAPEPNRGKRNELAYVKFVAEKVARIKGIDLAEVEDVTERNTQGLFGMVMSNE